MKLPETPHTQNLIFYMFCEKYINVSQYRICGRGLFFKIFDICESYALLNIKQEV